MTKPQRRSPWARQLYCIHGWAEDQECPDCPADGTRRCYPRQQLWRVRMYAAGRCMNCGRWRGRWRCPKCRRGPFGFLPEDERVCPNDGTALVWQGSLYKSMCRRCGERQTKRKRSWSGVKEWKKGGPGKPPLGEEKDKRA